VRVYNTPRTEVNTSTTVHADVTHACHAQLYHTHAIVTYSQQFLESLVLVYVSQLHEDKMLSYRRETALQGTLVLAESGRSELGDNIILIL